MRISHINLPGPPQIPVHLFSDVGCSREDRGARVHHSRGDNPSRAAGLALEALPPRALHFDETAARPRRTRERVALQHETHMCAPAWHEEQRHSVFSNRKLSKHFTLAQFPSLIDTFNTISNRTAAPENAPFNCMLENYSRKCRMA